MNGTPDEEAPSPADSTMSSNISIASGELPSWFVQRHGRAFHTSSAPYFLPADAAEMLRLNTQHRLMKTLLESNIFGPLADHLAPAPGRRKRVLDLGSGSGIWVEEMAAEFPHVKFIGIDLVPTATQFPSHNAQFECYDFLAEAGLRVRSDSIDAVHVRDIAFGINNYARLAQESLRALHPGGYFLTAELDIRPDFMASPNGAPPTPALHELMHTMLTVVQPPHPPSSIPQTLLTAGFQQITASIVWVPLGEWMDTANRRLVGRMALESMVQLVHALRPFLLDRAGAVEADVERLLVAAQLELENIPAGVSIPYHLVHARRPL